MKRFAKCLLVAMLGVALLAPAAFAGKTTASSSGGGNFNASQLQLGGGVQSNVGGAVGVSTANNVNILGHPIAASATGFGAAAGAGAQFQAGCGPKVQCQNVGASSCANASISY